MCINPTYVWLPVANNYEKKPVPCRKCWACRKNKVNDLTGLAVAECAVSDWSMAMTLTYRPHNKPKIPDAARLDHQRIPKAFQTQAIHKEDFQNYMKAVRRSCHKCRYLVAGEYGSRKGRTHFHVLLIGNGTPPEIPKPFADGRWHIPHWPWGHVNIDTDINENAVRYITKYLTKKDDPKLQLNEEHSEEWLSWSKRPLLGESFIRHLAERQAEMETFPYTLNYLPPGISNNKNRYSLKGAAEFKYFDHLLALWPEGYNAPKTEWMENAFLRYIKKRTRKDWEYLQKNYALHVQSKILADEMRHSPEKKIDTPRVHVEVNEYAIYLDAMETYRWLLDRGIETPLPEPPPE